MKSLIALAVLLAVAPAHASTFACGTDFLMLQFIKRSWDEPIYILRNRDEEKRNGGKPIYGGKFQIVDNPFKENQRQIEFTLYCSPAADFTTVHCSSSPNGSPEIMFKRGPESGPKKERAFKELPYSKTAGAYFICAAGCKQDLAQYVFADCPSD